MHEEITAIDEARPVARQEKKPASRPRPPADKETSPEPPAAHPHKGRLLDVIA